VQIVLPPTVAIGTHPKQLWSRHFRRAALGFGLHTLQTIAKPITVAKLREAIAAPCPRASFRSAPATVNITTDEFQRALAAQELLAHYQPKVAFSTRAMVGAEALVRWKHPVHGLLSPSVFLPLAQKMGKLDELTDGMLAKAIAQCATWQLHGIITSVSVNLPIVSLLSRELPARIDKILAAHSVGPSQLTLEVTEDGWLQQQAVAREVLTRLRVRGFGLSIDDFGTGYSTLQQLLHAPFNELKLDQSFVSKALEDEESRIVLSSSIVMAHQLKLEVVAEGIENAAQWRLLADLGCDVAQGFYVAVRCRAISCQRGRPDGTPLRRRPTDVRPAFVAGRANRGTESGRAAAVARSDADRRSRDHDVFRHFILSNDENDNGRTRNRQRRVDRHRAGSTGRNAATGEGCDHAANAR
jgi:EAL domain-containing protein (putative c-di-GMP-specific phosphodiesterase class I)